VCCRVLLNICVVYVEKSVLSDSNTIDQIMNFRIVYDDKHVEYFRFYKTIIANLKKFPIFLYAV